MVIGVAIAVVVIIVGLVLIIFRKSIFKNKKNQYKKAKIFTNAHDEKDRKNFDNENENTHDVMAPN